MDKPVLSRESSLPESVPAPAPDEVRNNFANVVPEKFEKIFFRLHGNGLSLDKAAEIIFRGICVPEIAMEWKNPLTDSVNARLKKCRAAEELGAAFLKTEGSLERAAGTIRARAWSEECAQQAETLANALVAAAKNIADAAANWAAVSGLLPLAGTLSEIRELTTLVGSLLAVRGEDPALIFGADAAKKLSRVGAAAALKKNGAHHRKLLSLPYPESALRDSRLEFWLELWNKAEFSSAILRWRLRRKVIRALCALAGTDAREPVDPRVDLGNLIAVRDCEKEFKEKYSDVAVAFPSFFDTSDCEKISARVVALEKARAGVAKMLAKFECIPEKRDAWEFVFKRWFSGNDAAFSVGGAVDVAYEALRLAGEHFWGNVGELSSRMDAGLPPEAVEFPASAEAFATELLADKEHWRSVCAWNALAFSAGHRGMSALVAAIRARAVPAESAKVVFETNYCRRWAELVFESEPALKKWANGKTAAEFLAEIERSRQALRLREDEARSEPVPAEPEDAAADGARGEFCLADSGEIRETSGVSSK